MSPGRVFLHVLMLVLSLAVCGSVVLLGPDGYPLAVLGGGLIGAVVGVLKMSAPAVGAPRARPAIDARTQLAADIDRLERECKIGPYAEDNRESDYSSGIIYPGPAPRWHPGRMWDTGSDPGHRRFPTRPQGSE